ncbi:MAG: putative dsRNA-binding protein, partial [Alphaproteobacteria bacterium]
KTRLQGWALGRALALPTYAMLDKTGPAHAPTITVSVNIDGLGEIKAVGPSRRVAEQDAARVALETFADGSET